MQKYLIDADILQSVIDYMAMRPWKEVAGVMPKLLDLERHADSAPKAIRNSDTKGQP
jgi:hypothetical protein